MLPSGPWWKSHVLHPHVPTKCQAILYYHDPIDCLQSLLSHPSFASRISFVPRKVWSSSACIVCIYEDWETILGIYRQVEQFQNFLFFDPAKDQIPNGATLLGVVLSSDKINISVMTGNRMAHPLLISLTNIDPDIRSKGSLHAHVLLTLLPIASFLHPKTHIRSLLSDRLVHESLDFVLRPLKIAASIGIMMSDPIGSLRYCFTPLIAYITDTPEQCLLLCVSPKASPVSTATHKEFGDSSLHPPRTATKTLGNIDQACAAAHLDDWDSRVSQGC